MFKSEQTLEVLLHDNDQLSQFQKTVLLPFLLNRPPDLYSSTAENGQQLPHNYLLVKPDTNYRPVHLTTKTIVGGLLVFGDMGTCYRTTDLSFKCAACGTNSAQPVLRSPLTTWLFISRFGFGLGHQFRSVYRLKEPSLSPSYYYRPVKQVNSNTLDKKKTL